MTKIRFMPENLAFIKALLAICLIAGSLQVLMARPSPALPENQIRRINEVFAAWDTSWTPGVALAVVKDGKIVYSKGYGYANMEYDIPVTPNTIFHIASISKQFTTFSILLLEADGRLSLDDEIHAHIPELPDFGHPITLRQLAQNISGIRDQWNLLGMAGWRLDDVITTEQVIRLLSRQKELNFPPGEEYLYSNSGFTLLAEVVARVSGQSFAEFTRERIFEPLGMKHTLFYDDHERIVKNRAYSYAGRNGNYSKRVLSYATVGATSLFTTAEDLSQWAMNFENPIVGNKEILREMSIPGILNNGKSTGYGLGLNAGTHRGLPMISHGGADAGFRTFFAHFPEQATSIVVFSNDAGFNSSAMAMRVAGIVLEEFLEPEARDEIKFKPHVISNPALLTYYEGHFMQAADNHLIFKTSGDTLSYYTSINKRPTKLIPRADNIFVTSDGNQKFEFYGEPKGPADSVAVTRGNETNTLFRVAAFDPERVDLNELTGYFYSKELDITYTLKIENKENEAPRLIASQLRIGEIRLEPLTPDHFSGSVWFANRFRFVRDANGKITGFRLSGSRARDVWFETK